MSAQAENRRVDDAARDLWGPHPQGVQGEPSLRLKGVGAIVMMEPSDG